MQQMIRVHGAGKCTRKDLNVMNSYGTAGGTLTQALDNAYFCFNRAQTLIQKAIIADEQRHKALHPGDVGPDKLAGNMARHASHDCLTYNNNMELPDTVYGLDAQCVEVCCRARRCVYYIRKHTGRLVLNTHTLCSSMTSDGVKCLLCKQQQRNNADNLRLIARTRAASCGYVTRPYYNLKCKYNYSFHVDVANTIRLQLVHAFFADARGGCNGSIRWEWQEARKSYPDFSKFPQHAGLYKANFLLFGVQGDSGMAPAIRGDRNKVCAKMPDADIISIAGMVALIRRGALPTGGCTWYPGRIDAPPGGFDDTTSMAASPGLSVEQLLTAVRFKGLGFSKSDLETFGFTGDRKNNDKSGVYSSYTEEDAQVADFVATLSGAHTVGVDRAHSPYKNVMDTATGAMMSTIVRATGRMDLTPDIFDAQYFKQRRVSGAVLQAGDAPLVHNFNFVATLSGAHSVGVDRAHPPYKNVMDTATGARMSTIVRGTGRMDPTPDTFDARYFQQRVDFTRLYLQDELLTYPRKLVWEGGGNFASDRILKCATLPDPDKPLGNRVCKTANSPFAPIVEELSAGDPAADELFRQKFCQAYQAMTLAGYKVPADYAKVAQNFKFSQFPAGA
ncbi:hypothetical protein JKP88DRAFT_255195 [Tribonema minus]|uniref:Plant heme peroxidase family profile domain-containing protein n=1 Tax=Tribonema minus TaxID=303371 RepID=A0A835Z3J9_9STRA|nr:hypothetical protein JKP88DRAFT_255195 [Tribonema minus]